VLLSAAGIGLLVVALLLSEQGGSWTLVFPAFLVVLLIAVLLYRRVRRQRDDGTKAT
jgi:membrane protein implicated in regulation of membrane protease activity